MRKIILASASSRRREILERAGIPFTIEPADIKEDMTQKAQPRELVRLLAMQKAATVATRHPDAIVIGADTVVAFAGRVWGKPKSERDARVFLRAFSGKAHDVWTGFCVIDTRSGKRAARSVKTRVYFRNLSARDIARYIALSESSDHAGAYALELNGAVLVERIDGDLSNVIGLPLAALLEDLQKFGVRT